MAFFFNLSYLRLLPASSLLLSFLCISVSAWGTKLGLILLHKMTSPWNILVPVSVIVLSNLVNLYFSITFLEWTSSSRQTVPTTLRRCAKTLIRVTVFGAGVVDDQILPVDSLLVVLISNSTLLYVITLLLVLAAETDFGLLALSVVIIPRFLIYFLKHPMTVRYVVLLILGVVIVCVEDNYGDIKLFAATNDQVVRATAKAKSLFDSIRYALVLIWRGMIWRHKEAAAANRSHSHVVADELSGKSDETKEMVYVDGVSDDLQIIAADEADGNSNEIVDEIDGENNKMVVEYYDGETVAVHVAAYDEVVDD